MGVRIRNVLTSEQLSHFRAVLAGANWADGRQSAGYLSQAVKRNSQLPDDDPNARELGATILSSLEKNSDFVTTALPLRVLPPQFNRYQSNQAYGKHIDGAIRSAAGSCERIRTDLSATLFLTEPEDYVGGELVIRDAVSERRIKLPAGDMFVYSAATVHEIEPVTDGERLAAFFWIQSMVRDASKRALLLDLDSAVQKLARDEQSHPTLVEFAGVYHNLLRMWCDT